MGIVSSAITVWNINWMVLLIAVALMSSILGVYVGLFKHTEGKENIHTYWFTLGLYGLLGLLLLFPVIFGRQIGNNSSNTVRMSAGRPAATLLVILIAFFLYFNYINTGKYMHYALGGKTIIIGLIILLISTVKVKYATQSVQAG